MNRFRHYFMPAMFRRSTYVEMARLALAHPLLPPAFHGFSAAVISDLHFGRWIGVEYLRHVTALARSMKPTILVLLGDLVECSGGLSRQLGDELAGLCAEIPTYAVLGNHEYYNGVGHSVEAYRQAGMQLLIDENRLIGPDGRIAAAGPRIALVGLDDVIESGANPTKALAGVPESMYTLLLSHSPDAADDPLLRGHFMLAGHTHGGQIRVLGKALHTQTRNHRYAFGLVQGPKFPVYITRGLGIGGLPFRIDCPPELVKLELRTQV